MSQDYVRISIRAAPINRNMRTIFDKIFVYGKNRAALRRTVLPTTHGNPTEKTLVRDT
jgi:hypothetical protein